MRSTCGGGGGGGVDQVSAGREQFSEEVAFNQRSEGGERSSSSRGTDGANTLRCVEAEQVQQKKIKVWR